MAQWKVDVTLKDANGMETTVAVDVAADDATSAAERAEQIALDEMEFTGEHVSMTAVVDKETIRLITDHESTIR